MSRNTKEYNKEYQKVVNRKSELMRMCINYIKRYEITCQECKAKDSIEVEQGKDYLTMPRPFQQRGWSTHNEKVLCPNCMNKNKGE